MFFDRDIRADRLPPRTCCLTYDDGPGSTAGRGPGPKTRELGAFLRRNGIRATFFVVGRHAEEHLELIRQLAAWGHLIGNHTYTHPGLASVSADSQRVADELDRADALIRKAVKQAVTYFRAPYGNWRELEDETRLDKPRSRVAEIANRLPLARRTVGPVNWDLCAGDWHFWHGGYSAKACATAYLEEIERLGRGIILMHDSSADDDLARQGNRTYEATVLLVKRLLRRGYRFLGLDEIPQVRSAARVQSQVTLAIDSNQPIVRSGDTGLRIAAGGVPEVFGLIPLPNDVVALRCSNGCLLSVDRATGTLGVDATEIGPLAMFACQFLDRERLAIQVAADAFLGLDAASNTLQVVPSSKRAEFHLQVRFPELHSEQETDVPREAIMRESTV